jgi:hypothetical protein
MTTKNVRDLVGITQVAGEKFIRSIAAYIGGENFDSALSQQSAHFPANVAAGAGY